MTYVRRKGANGLLSSLDLLVWLKTSSFVMRQDNQLLLHRRDDLFLETFITLEIKNQT